MVNLTSEVIQVVAGQVHLKYVYLLADFTDKPDWEEVFYKEHKYRIHIQNRQLQLYFNFMTICFDVTGKLFFPK